MEFFNNESFKCVYSLFKSTLDMGNTLVKKGCRVVKLEHSLVIDVGTMVKLDCMVERWDCSQVILLPGLE